MSILFGREFHNFHPSDVALAESLELEPVFRKYLQSNQILLTGRNEAHCPLSLKERLGPLVHKADNRVLLHPGRFLLGFGRWDCEVIYSKYNFISFLSGTSSRQSHVLLYRSCHAQRHSHEWDTPHSHSG